MPEAALTQGLIAATLRHMPEDGMAATALPNLTIFRAQGPTDSVPILHKPAVCLIVQGAKRVMLGTEVFLYDAATYFVVSVDLALSGQVIQATPDQPYLCLRFDLDLYGINDLLFGLDLGKAEGREAGPGAFLSPVTAPLQDAFLRLLGLLDRPADQPVLGPLIEREILYRLLTGPQGARLRQLARPGSRDARIGRAIGWIKANYRDTLRVAEVADAAGMSPSALHLYFKQMTQMSPLQYQKHIRLQEARRLILAEGMDAASAGFSVGYESPSQFSREYRRLFGAPPRRDTDRLRADPTAGATL
ncbi:AraC family transcriptional regulator [Elstera cyanobacteriorum]|uniref:AraC family transcriptional regulator CmrA n=1 Tax=Elstera cyanobacteriorum TaxID=2022747 RepID=A0A255XKT2_9PROT|nr:AraC family transcriptional regulator [Elstera cyanobacteriorum]OYQ17025.1 AraC family transcriptional regulator CmrA [Elstera cyanobacteriorum]GFZ82821.1 AraC family transcriptional regulator [Elstera cyanobacteriorum]